MNLINDALTIAARPLIKTFGSRMETDMHKLIGKDCKFSLVPHPDGVQVMVFREYKDGRDPECYGTFTSFLRQLNGLEQQQKQPHAEA